MNEVTLQLNVRPRSSDELKRVVERFEAKWQERRKFRRRLGLVG